MPACCGSGRRRRASSSACCRPGRVPVRVGTKVRVRVRARASVRTRQVVRASRGSLASSAGSSSIWLLLRLNETNDLAPPTEGGSDLSALFSSVIFFTFGKRSKKFCERATGGLTARAGCGCAHARTAGARMQMKCKMCGEVAPRVAPRCCCCATRGARARASRCRNLERPRAGCQRGAAPPASAAAEVRGGQAQMSRGRRSSSSGATPNWRRSRRFGGVVRVRR